VVEPDSLEDCALHCAERMALMSWILVAGLMLASFVAGVVADALLYAYERRKRMRTLAQFRQGILGDMARHAYPHMSRDEAFEKMSDRIRQEIKQKWN
jgi:hypothetical protein